MSRSNESAEGVLNYIEDSLSTIQNLTEEKEKLAQQLSTLKDEKVKLEKVASDLTFEEDKIEEVVDRLTKMSYIHPLYSEKVATQIKEDNSKALDLLVKISEAALSAPTSGEGIASSNDTFEINGDPDGWFSLKDI